MRPRLERGPCALLVAIGLSLSACGKAPALDADPQNHTAAASNDAAHALETLAAESGVIGESQLEDPGGSYGRAYEGGEDRLCLAAKDGAPGSYRLGVEIRIGEEEYCRGTGTAQRSGSDVVLTLAGGRCTIPARYEGDRLVLPGAVDPACASLCSERGSLAGVAFPRISASSVVAASDGKLLCGR